MTAEANDSTLVAKNIRTAIKQGDVQSVKALLAEYPTALLLMTPFGTWLHVAAAHGQLEIVEYLISVGADVNRRGGILGGGPLNEAASSGHIDVVKYLVASGAGLDVSDPRFNPLFGAIHGGHTDVARFLIDAGIDTAVRYSGDSMHEMDALAFAREWGRRDIETILLSRHDR